MSIRVAEVALTRVRLPLVHSFETSSHRKSHLEHILVRVVDEGGRVGWGEIASASDPFFSAENVGIDWLIARDYLVPALLHGEWQHPSEAAADWAKVRGNNFAKAGFDMALWSLWSSGREASLSAELGGTRPTIEAGVSLGIEKTVDALLEQVAAFVASGYRRVKLKIAPGWDVVPATEVRSAFPDLILQVDANGAYSEREHDTVGIFRGLDPLGLAMIEQPFEARDFLSHARLRQSIDTPVCLDESVESIDDLRTAIALGAIDILNIKVSRMGGLTAASAAHDGARAEGIPVWCGGMHEFGIGRAANLAIASLPGFTLPSDVSASEKYYARDVIVPPVIAVDGLVDVPTGPGLGFEVDEGFVAEMAVQEQVFTRS